MMSGTKLVVKQSEKEGASSAGREACIRLTNMEAGSGCCSAALAPLLLGHRWRWCPAKHGIRWL